MASQVTVTRHAEAAPTISREAIVAAQGQYVLPAKKVYAQQYSSIYFCRLRQLRPSLTATIQRIFDSEERSVPICERIIDASPGKEIVVMGTLYKDMPLKPCVLDEYEADSATEKDVVERVNFCHADDALALEDEHGRINLVLASDCRVYERGLPPPPPISAEERLVDIHAVRVANLVSGIVIGVQGAENDMGDFVVTRIFYLEPVVPASGNSSTSATIMQAPSTTNAMANELKLEAKANYIMFLSDLSLGNPAIELSSSTTPTSADVESKGPASSSLSNSSSSSSKATDAAGPSDGLSTRMALDLCLDFVSGLASSSASEASLPASISRVVLAGNTLYKPPPVNVLDLVDTTKARKEAEERERAFVSNSLRQLDLVATQIAAACELTIIPGANDPSNFTWPQQPLHASLFPSASTYSTFSTCTNPAVTVAGPQVLVGTDGRNVTDIVRFTDLTPLQALESSLRWRLVAPTAPDTLGCYPFQDIDPFVFGVAPSVYYAGGQAEAAAAVHTSATGARTLLLAVPSFVKTRTAVLVNAETLQATTITFGGPSASTTHS